MPHTPRWLLFALAGFAFAAVGGASAAGFGPGASSTMMGQALDFTVLLRLDAGETLSPECVSAEVTVGDRRLPASLVRTALEMTGSDTARIRVATTLAIDEPVVGVWLNAGCATARLSRRFVVLADPPFVPPQTSALAPAPAAAFAPAFAAAPPDAPVPTQADAAMPLGQPDARALPRGEAAAAGPATSRGAAGAQSRDAARQGAMAGTRAERRAAAAARAEPSRRARRAAPAAPAARAAAQSAPRLKLEAPDAAGSTAAAVAVDLALQAVVQAASAARAAAVAASAAAERIGALERSVETLRGEAVTSKDLAVQLRERLALAEQSGRWTWPLLAAVLLLTALAAWLAWRLNASERARQRVWQAAAAAPPVVNSELTASKLPTAPIPFVTSEVAFPAAPAARRRPLPAWPAPAPVDPRSTLSPPLPDPRTPAIAKAVPVDFAYDNAMERTEPLPAQGALDDAAPRDVSIEELIDLEQQAEFFVVLGQDQAAVELLVEHLRNTGGGSPLPYLKLLEIYRRSGDRSDYERMRTRFNHRFNAYAPDWDTDLQHGRTLDSYAGVIPRLQQVWARPLDAMAELEALLFRKSRGELFELPAYREVLFLYSLARDLLDRETADSGNVDLLLPLADGGDFSSTAPVPFLGLERDAGTGHQVPADRATAPVDFDLTADGNRPASLFGPVDETPERGRRR